MSRAAKTGPQLAACGFALGFLAVASAAAIAAPDRAAQVARADHVRLFIEFLDVAEPKPVDDDFEGAPIRVQVEADGTTVWNGELDSFVSIFRVGPITGPARARFTVSVWRQDSTGKHFVAKVALANTGKKATQSFSQGNLNKLTLSIAPVDVWVIPELTVIVPFELQDAAKKLLTAALADFSERLVDATDGQIRIEEFSVYQPPLPPGVTLSTAGVIYVRGRAFAEGKVCAHDVGRPARPGRIPLALSKTGQGDPRRLGAQIMHEFGHAYLGLEDEYVVVDGGAKSGCPDHDPDAQDPGAEAQAGSVCFMNAPSASGREVCRAATHDHDNDTPQTKAHGADCWTRMTDVLKKDVGLTLLKDAPIPGPPPPSPARFTFTAESEILDLTAGGERLDDDSINAVVRNYGDDVGRCLTRTGERTAVIHFTIRGTDGRVMRVEVNSKKTTPLYKCVRKVMLRMRFPTFSAPRTTARVQISL